MDELRSSGKPFEISKRAVWEAWEKVRANKGAAGVDGVSIEEFEKDLKNNLYKVWNRMSSGTYLPPAVRAVEIPKSHGGGTRILGVPTIADRIAQTVVARVLEARVEPIFHPDSSGYRPRRSALDAVGACRRRCWSNDWVIDLDIRKFFDSVSWDLIVKAVEANTDLPWVVLYVKRWLVAHVRFGRGRQEKDRHSRHLARRPTSLIATCSVRSIPWEWAEQTTAGGRILVDLKTGVNAGNLVLLHRHPDRLEGRFLPKWAGFMAMRHDQPAPPPRRSPRCDTNAITRTTTVGPQPWDNLVVWFLAQFHQPPDLTFGLTIDEAGHQPVATFLAATDGSWSRSTTMPTTATTSSARADRPRCGGTSRTHTSCGTTPADLAGSASASP